MIQKFENSFVNLEGDRHKSMGFRNMQNNNPDLKKLGARLKALRIKKGFISLERFAFDNELSRVLYSNYESGKGNITYKNLLKVTRALNISLKDFFSEGFD